MIPRCYICYIFGQIGQAITLKGFIKNLSQLVLFVRQVAPGVWVPQTGQVRQEYVDSSKLCGRGGGSVTHSDSPPEEPARFLGPVRSRSLLSCCRVPRQAPKSWHVAAHRNTRSPNFCKLIKAPSVVSSNILAKYFLRSSSAVDQLL